MTTTALPPSAASATRSGPVRGERWIAGALVALGMALRVREALRTPFWFDELFTLHIARMPLPRMMDTLAHDIHPPLFTLLVAAWRAVGGESERWLKTLPLAIGLATLLVTWRCARRMFGPRVALLALALLAVHPRHIYFSQELRSYGLLALAVTLSAWAAWAWLERPTRAAAVGWVLAAALTLHTHYLGGVVLAVLGLMVLWGCRHDPSRIARWLALQLGVFALLAPILPMFVPQLRRSGSHWIMAPAWTDLVDLWRKLAFSSSVFAPILALLLVLAVTRGTRRRPAAFVLVLAIGSVLLPFALTLAGAHLYVSRYMYFTVPLWCTALAAGLATLGPAALRRTVAALVVAIGLRAAWLLPPFPEAVELREAAGLLSGGMRPGDRLFCADTHSLFCVAWHQGVMRGRLIRSPEPLPYFVGSQLVPDSLQVEPAVLRATAASGGRWWGVYTREAYQAGRRNAALFDSLARGGTRRYSVVTVWAGQPGMLPAGR